MKRLSLIAIVAATGLAVAAPQAAFAEKDPYYTGVFSDTAVGGYDAVSFFAESGPVKGDKKISTEYKGAEFRFASQENLDKFLENPEAYAPQYGGYCAWAVSQGYTAKGDPKHWKVVDGKLYLNYNAKVQKDWEEDIPGFIDSADKEWPNVLN